MLVSLAKILGGIAYSVESFGLQIVSGDLSPPLLERPGDRLRKKQGLFDEANDCLANSLQHVHKTEVVFRISPA